MRRRHVLLPSLRHGSVAVSVVAALGCASVIGADFGDFHFDRSDAASTNGGDIGAGGGGAGPANGGSPSTGSRSGGGGVPTTGGQLAIGGNSSCGVGRKMCGGICVMPAPALGCDLANCDACPAAPPGGFAMCSASACDFACYSGYQRMGNGCVFGGAGGLTATGGTAGSDGGSTGSGGTMTGGAKGTGGVRMSCSCPSTGGAATSDGGPAPCGASACPSCSLVLGPACCTSQGLCGCPAVPFVTSSCH